MPELHEDAAAPTMHGLGDEPPAGDLLGRMDAGRTRIALPLGRDLRALGDDQSGTGTLRVVFGVERLGHIAGAGPVAGHRRHDDAVGHVNCRDFRGFKKAGCTGLQTFPAASCAVMPEYQATMARPISFGLSSWM